MELCFKVYDAQIKHLVVVIWSIRLANLLNVLFYWDNVICTDKHLIRCQMVQYIPRNMHTVFALMCFVVVIHWLISPYPSGLLHWHCGNLTIAPVPAKQPWWIWINISCEFIMNDCITTTKQSTTKPSAYFLGYTVYQYVTKWLHSWQYISMKWCKPAYLWLVRFAIPRSMDASDCVINSNSWNNKRQQSNTTAQL